MNFSPVDDRYIYELFSKNIKYYRMHNNSRFSNYGKMTQEKLAEVCDLSHSLISNIESKKVQQSFSLAVLYRIARALEIEMSLLFIERDDYGNTINAN
jgi:DNA-binding XRE family transcriptional regulator